MIGEVKSNYKVSVKISKGLGKVYQTADSKLNQTAAVKFFSSIFPFYKVAIKRFTCSIQSFSILDHLSFCNPRTGG
jgi:hypothetical protein